MKTSPAALLRGIAVAIFHSSIAESAAVGQALPTVDLGYSIHQATINASGQYPYLNFSNIRYGQAPVGPLRFSAPLPPQGRNTTVNNGQQDVICPQADPLWGASAIEFIAAYLTGQNISNFTNPTTQQSAAGGLSASSLPKPDPRTSEDCLFLDVVVPQRIFNTPRKTKQNGPYNMQCKVGSPCVENPAGAPVLVWIYGGGYTTGDKTSWGSPASLIARSQENGGEGVVYVAMNYRLGLFGWLSATENVTSNVGLLDQRLALEWVQQNIHLFGGDPSRVTVMGESAGGASIMHQITAYGGEGSIPFQKAIPQSPAFQPLIPEQAKAIFAKVLRNASFVANTSITSAEELRALPFEALYATNVIVTALSQYGSFTFGPAIDPSNGSFVPDFPFRLLAEGKHHNVSVMAGHNFNEGLLFTPPFVQSEAIYTKALESLFPTANSSVISTITDVLYPPVFDGTYGYSDYIGRTALFLGDLSINCNAHILASALPSGYAYRFTVPPALHGQDVAYTFFNGDTTTLNDGFPVNRTLAAAFQTYITNFAMTGKPTAEGLQPFVVYGPNATVSNIGLANLGGHSKDPAAKPACTFWNNAPYYAPA